MVVTVWPPLRHVVAPKATARFGSDSSSGKVVTRDRRIRRGSRRNHQGWRTPTVEFLGMTFNVDTMYTTVIAALLTVGFLYWVARRASSDVPNKVQAVTELVVNQARTYIEDAVGHGVRPGSCRSGSRCSSSFCSATGSAGSLRPRSGAVGPPTADVNLVYAMTATVVILYTYLGVKRKGFRYAGDWFTVKPSSGGRSWCSSRS